MKEAILKGDLKKVQNLVNEPSFSKNSENGVKALILAAKHGKLEIVKYLVDEKKYDPLDLGANFRSALHYAIESGHEDVVLYFIAKDLSEFGAGVGFEEALNFGNIKIMKALYEKVMADIYTIELLVSLFDGASDSGKEFLIDLISRPPHNKIRTKTALHIAAENGDVEIVKRLIAKDVDLKAEDINSRTALDVVRNKQDTHKEIDKLLRNALIENLEKRLKAKGQVININRDAPDPGPIFRAALASRDEDLMKAAWEDFAQKRAIEDLIKDFKELPEDNVIAKNFIIDLAYKIPMLLHVAAKEGCLEMVKGIKGISITTIDNKRQTPLFCAIEGAAVEVVEYLLQSTSDSDLGYKDINGDTVLDFFNKQKFPPEKADERARISELLNARQPKKQAQELRTPVPLPTTPPPPDAPKNDPKLLYLLGSALIVIVGAALCFTNLKEICASYFTKSLEKGRDL